MNKPKDYSPYWFKLYLDKRSMLEALPAENFKNVMLACFDYTESRDVPQNLNDCERIAFLALFPNLNESWVSYEQRVEASRAAARKRSAASDTERRRTVSDGVELDKERDKELKLDSKKEREKKQRFTPPSLSDVQNYCSEKGYNVDAERFIAFYESKGWMVGKNHMKDWQAAIRTWETRTEEQAATKQPPKKSNSFSSFQQNDYNFDELEKQLTDS